MVSALDTDNEMILQKGGAELDKFDFLVVFVAVLGVLLVGLIVFVAIKVKGEKKARSITRILFLTTQVAALGWVTVSYLIAIYSTVKLGQPFPVTDLSGQAVTVILGVNIAKVVENIFEHNSGGIFGTSDTKGV